jgi:hypothetical protein
MTEVAGLACAQRLWAGVRATTTSASERGEPGREHGGGGRECGGGAAGFRAGEARARRLRAKSGMDD